jgi:hypothetical protein
VPAPKNPNTVNATHAARDANRRRKIEEAAATIRSAGGDAVLPFAMVASVTHAWRLAVRPHGEASQLAWKFDSHANQPIWYTFGGAAVRLAELEARKGIEARMA